MIVFTHQDSDRNLVFNYHEQIFQNLEKKFFIKPP